MALLIAHFASREYIDAFFAEHRAAPLISLEANSIQALSEIAHHTTLATVHLIEPRSDSTTES